MSETHTSRNSGFTLIELMLTIAVAAVIAAVAIPNMRDFIRNNRLAAGSNDLLRSLQMARSEAIKRQQVIAVCASSAPDLEDPSCSDGKLTGWFVFVDANNNWQRDTGEEVLDRASVDEGVSVSNDATGKVSFAPTGFANSTPGQAQVRRVVLCDIRGNQSIGDNSVARTLIIAPTTGRARVSKIYADVTRAIRTAGNCP